MPSATAISPVEIKSDVSAPDAAEIRAGLTSARAAIQAAEEAKDAAKGDLRRWLCAAQGNREVPMAEAAELAGLGDKGRSNAYKIINES